MEELIVGIVLLVAEALILAIITRSQKAIGQIKNEIKLTRIKQESFVEAYSFYEGNGLLDKYTELVEQKKNDEQWIKTV